MECSTPAGPLHVSVFDVPVLARRFADGHRRAGVAAADTGHSANAAVRAGSARPDKTADSSGGEKRRSGNLSASTSAATIRVGRASWRRPDGRRYAGVVPREVVLPKDSPERSSCINRSGTFLDPNALNSLPVRRHRRGEGEGDREEYGLESCTRGKETRACQGERRKLQGRIQENQRKGITPLPANPL
jgi:hypothetical protein